MHKKLQWKKKEALPITVTVTKLMSRNRLSRQLTSDIGLFSSQKAWRVDGSRLTGALPGTLTSLMCAVIRRFSLVGANPIHPLSLQVVAAQAVYGGNDMD